MNNEEKDTHPFMIRDGRATRLATYEEVQQLQETLNNVGETLTVMSKSITELSKCAKEFTEKFVDITNSTQKDIDELKREFFRFKKEYPM